MSILRKQWRFVGHCPYGWTKFRGRCFDSTVTNERIPSMRSSHTHRICWLGYVQYRGQNSSSSPRKRYRFFSRRFGVGRVVQTLQFVRPIKRIRSVGTTIVAVPRQKGPSECDGIISLFFMLLPARRSVIFPKNKEFDS